MALFNFGKKEEKKVAPTCACNGSCSTSKAAEIVNDCCPEAKTEICCIKVLGSGCANCHSLYENAKEAKEKINERQLEARNKNMYLNNRGFRGFNPYVEF